MERVRQLILEVAFAGEHRFQHELADFVLFFWGHVEFGGGTLQTLNP